MKIEGLSAARIALALNGNKILAPSEYKRSVGLPYPRNGFADKEYAKWSASTIIRILKDKTYVDTLVQGKKYTPNYKIKRQFTTPPDEWVRVEYSHEAIISRLDFETVQRIMLLDTRASPGDDRVNFFSGILICGCCGGNMTRKTVAHDDKIYRYYYCPTGKKHGCHSPIMVQEEWLVDTVFGKIKEHLSQANAFAERFTGMDNDAICNELTKEQVLFIAKQQEKLQTAWGHKSRLSSSLASGIINEEEYQTMKVSYTEQILTVEQSIELASKQIRDIISRKDERLRWLAEICRSAEGDKFDRATVVRLIKQIYIVGKDYIEIESAVTVFGISFEKLHEKQDILKNL